MTEIKSLPHPSELIGKYVANKRFKPFRKDNLEWQIDCVFGVIYLPNGTYVLRNSAWGTIGATDTQLFPTRQAAQEYIEGVKQWQDHNPLTISGKWGSGNKFREVLERAIPIRLP